MIKDDGTILKENNPIKYITFKDFQRKKIIDKNMEAIQRTDILQFIKDSNKKYGRKLTKEERKELIKRIEKKIKRPLKEEDYRLLNERLITEQKEGSKR